MKFASARRPDEPSAYRTSVFVLLSRIAASGNARNRNARRKGLEKDEGSGEKEKPSLRKVFPSPRQNTDLPSEAAAADHFVLQ
ncbi:MAG: hypothetical protein J6Y54_00020, partial [Lentisphaeria bacterium]|nr:hypothetical protein [Lentisphaeria bacterium]